MTTTTARSLDSWPQPVSAGNNAPRTRRRIKDVKSNLPPDSKGGSCELYGTPVAPARPCTQKQQTPKHPDHKIYQYQSIYAHGIVYVTVGSHPAHTACTPLLHCSPREMIDAGLCVRRPYSPTGNAYLYIAAVERCRSERSLPPSPVFGPGQPVAAVEPLPSKGSRHRSSHGRVSSNPQISARTCMGKCKTLSSLDQGVTFLSTSRQDLSVDSGTCACIVPSCTWRSGS